MSTKVFLSLSGQDAEYVRRIHRQLPAGVAYFYERSFSNAEEMIEEMRRGIEDSLLFVLFASASSINSLAVNFEISEAQKEIIFGKLNKILIFLLDSDLTYDQFPKWMRDRFIDATQYNENDIARIITDSLLDHISGNMNPESRIIGRGAASDLINRMAAEKLVENECSPNIYFFSGLDGIGRRSLVKHYFKNDLAAMPRLNQGPRIDLSEHASLVDLYRSLYLQVNVAVNIKRMTMVIEDFSRKNDDRKIEIIIDLLRYFGSIGQAVLLRSSNGFHEEDGSLKWWVQRIISELPSNIFLVFVANRQFPPEMVERFQNVVALRVPELQDADVAAIMKLVAMSYGLVDFRPSAELVRAIGGHPGLARAASRLAAAKGGHILERDPSQIFKIQDTILGEAVQPEHLNSSEHAILGVLSWVPSLGGDLLDAIVSNYTGICEEQFLESVSRLTSACFIVPGGIGYKISSAIRMPYRRKNPTPQELVDSMSSVLANEWALAKRRGEFREDLFDAFVFMHSLEGKLLPPELKSLLVPATLLDVLKQSYAYGRDRDDGSAFERVVSWGQMAEGMQMDETAREDVWSTVARAQIRLRRYREAYNTIQKVRDAGYKSADFLEGYSLRKQKKFDEAIPFLVNAVRGRKSDRAALHELALCYKQTGNVARLESLIESNSRIFNDSALFVDFKIGMHLSRGNLRAAEDEISQLKLLPDAGGVVERREAQILLKMGELDRAKAIMDKLIEWSGEDNFRNRALRAEILASQGQEQSAKKDLEYLDKLAGREEDAIRVRVLVYLAGDNVNQAELEFERLSMNHPADFILKARLLDAKAQAMPSGAEVFRREATALRSKYGNGFEIGDD